MKLNINFQIKDGKKIISRDTKGYKVLLNRVTKEFTKIKLDIHFTVTIVIQTNEKSALNASGLNYRKRGICYMKQGKITVWSFNCDNKHDQVLAVLAHELGHLYDYYKLGHVAFRKQGSRKQEQFADKFSFKMTKIEKSASITGQIRSLAAMNRIR